MRSPAPEPHEREREVRPEYREMRPEYREVPRPVREVEFHPDLVRWSAILGGTFAALGTMIVLAVLGALIGIGGAATAGGPVVADPTTVGIYATISMIIALFFGGWLAARTSATVGGMSGIVDGSLVWATVLVIALFLTGFGVASILGGGLGQFNVFAAPAPGMVDIAGSALWTLVGLILSYAAAVLGGIVGANQEETTYPRT